MDRAKLGNLGLVLLLVTVVAGVVLANVLPARFREHGGLLRVDKESGEKRVLIKGRWRPVPEFDADALKAKLDAAIATDLERQVVSFPLNVPPPEPPPLPKLPPKN